MTIIAYTQQLLDMEKLFGTSANSTVDALTFFVKSWHKWKLDTGFWMWLYVLAVKCYYIFSCFYGIWMCYGNFHLKTKLIFLFY